MNKEKYYVAYGSNLNVTQMAWRCPNAIPYKKSVLKNYQLVFRGDKHKAFLTIEPCKNKSVPIVIWKVTSEDEWNLDIYEGYPTTYRKVQLNLDNNQKAFTYIMNNNFRKGTPTKQYMETCIDGYEYFGFDTEILLSALDS